MRAATKPARRSSILVLLLGFIGCGLFHAARADNNVGIRETVEVLSRTRPPIRNAAGPVEQRYILTRIARPSAILLLFSGGGGRLRLADGTLEPKSRNFLVRSRRLFAGNPGRFSVALLDAASDILTLDTGLRGRRRGRAHLSDIAAVIEDVREKVPGGSRLPLCLVGTSRGAISAAAYAATAHTLLPGAPPIDCLVLTSPVTQGSRPPNDSLRDVPLAHVTAPALLVSHWHDACRVSPPQGTRLLEAALTNAPRVDERIFAGGLPALTGACRSSSPHGFFSIEPWVVRVIANWIHALS